MALTDNYKFWYLDPAEAMSDFPSMWNWNIDKIDTAIHGAADTSALESRIAELESGPRVTGPRNINSLIANGGEVSGELGLIRSGNTVTIYATSLKMDGSGSSKLTTLPDGFRPPATMQAEWCGRGGATEYFDIYASGSIWAGRRGKGNDHAGVITYVTDDDWPSTLPGNPA